VPSLQLRVSAVDSLGSITELHGSVPGAFDASPWLARLSGRHRAAPGEELTLSWQPSHAHLFDPASGARLSRISIATPAARPSHRHEH
jgi:ABC-type sugar transport system ATPase subunit